MLTNNAKYTVVLKTLLDIAHTKEAIDKAMSTYPIYKPKKFYDMIPTREELNKRILNHYKYREIFCPTVGRFIDELEITMCEIMPYYNERFKTVEIMADIDDPFGNVDVTETFEESRSDNAHTSGTSQSNSTNVSETQSNDNRTNETTTTANGKENKKNKFSDTPQNNVDNIDSYLTTYSEEDTTNNDTTKEESKNGGSTSSHSEDTANGSSSSSSESSSNGTTRHTFHKKGNQGVNTYAHDMNEFRTTIIDVVTEIINDKRIAELFMMIY